MIPKKIHYCWFGGSKLPQSVEKCIATWKQKCPDYEIIRWDESNFDVTSHPFMKAAYNAKAWAFVSDYARLKVVYENGGIYMDTDVELLKSLDEVLDCDSYFAVQQSDRNCATGLGFGAIKGSAVVLKMMEKYDEITFDINKKDNLACPLINTEVVKSIGYRISDEIQMLSEGVKIYPPRYFDPYMTINGGKNLLCEDTISIHHYDASWTSLTQKLKRKIVRLIGADKVIKIRSFFKRK